MSTDYVQVAPVALSANQFLLSFGVNVHTNYYDTAYGNLTAVEDALTYLGICNIRAGAANSAATDHPLEQLAADGYKVDLILSSPTEAAYTFLDSLAQGHPGSIIAVEGPNEVALNPIFYDGGTALENEAELQQSIYDDIHEDPALGGVPVANLTLGTSNAASYSQIGDLSTAADYGNAHIYAPYGNTPASNFNSALLLQQLATPGQQTLVTEAGYSSLASSLNGVDQVVQAKYTLDLLMDAEKAGVQTTFLYELFDEGSSGSGAENFYGLFNSDGTPKLAATAVHNLVAILNDQGTDPAFQPGTLAYTVQGLPADASQLLLQKQSGAYDIVLWAEPTIWNPTSHTEVAALSQPVTIQFGHVEETVSIFDPLQSSAPIATYSNVTQLQLDLTDHPLIVEVDDETGANSSAAGVPAIDFYTTGTSAVGSGFANTSQITLGGTGVADGTVAVMDGATLLGIAAVNASGAWSFTTAPLSDGSHSFSISGGPDGSLGSSQTLAVTIDTHAPTVPVVTSVIEHNLVTGAANEVTLSGTAEANSSVNIFSGIALIGTVAADANGNWTYALTAAPGEIGFKASNTDLAGNTSAASKPTVVSSTLQTGMTETWTYNADGSLHDIAFADVPNHPYTSNDTIYGGNGKPSVETFYNGSSVYEVETWNPDGTVHDIAYSNITGQPYTSNDTVYDANGKPTVETLYKSASLYEIKTWNVDGSVHDVAYFNITGQSYTTSDTFYGANTKASYETFSNGMIETWTYNADGPLHDLAYANVPNHPYTSNDTVYGLNGKASVETFYKGNSVVEVETWNSDGTVHDIAYFNITGQPYTSNDTVYGVNAKASVETFYKGAGLYETETWNSNGTVHDIAYFNIAGQPYTSTDTFYGANGKAAYETFSNGMTETWTYNADGTLHELAYANVPNHPYTSNDTIYGANGKPLVETFYIGSSVSEVEAWNPDGSVHDIAYLNIAGQPYTSNDTFYGANGKAVSETFYKGSGVYEVENWNSNSTVHDIAYFNIAGQAYTSTDTFYGANGKAAYETFSNGMTETWTYNADGSLHDLAFSNVPNHPYTSNDTVYGANGKPSVETFHNGSSVYEVETWNPDGSVHDIAYSNISGQPYTSNDTVYGANAKPAVETFYSNSSVYEVETWNPDGTVHDAAYFGVTNHPYTSYDKAYGPGNLMVAQEFNNTDGSETLKGSADQLIFKSSLGGESIASGAQTFNYSASSNVTLTGGGSNETFVFNAGFGHATITDFVPASSANANHDAIQFASGMFSSLADLLAHATQAGADTVIADHAGDTLVLQHVTAANLTTHDFVLA